MQIGGLGVQDSGLAVSQRWAVGRYYFVPPSLTITTSNALQNGTIRLVPFMIPHQITITKIGSEITGAGEAGSVLRLGVYSDNDGRPGALLVDAGTIDGTSTTVQEVTLAAPLTLGPAWYWAASVVQLAPTTQPTVRVANLAYGPSIDCRVQPVANYVNAGFSSAGFSSGSLPGTITVTGGTTTIARMFIKT